LLARDAMKRCAGFAMGAVLVLTIAACSGSSTGGIASPPVTCGDGTHRCCGASGFECVTLATACTLSDSACATPPPSDAGADVFVVPPDAAACPSNLDAVCDQPCSTPGLMCYSEPPNGALCAAHADGTPATWICMSGGAN
jgi:hypothetical protein